jgi:hypothetical protein
MSLNLGLLNMIVKLYLNSIFLLCFVNLYSMDDSAAERTVQTGSMPKRVFNIFTRKYDYMSPEAFEKYNQKCIQKAIEAEKAEEIYQQEGMRTPPPPGGGSRRKKRGNTKRRKTKKRKVTKKTKRRKGV